MERIREISIDIETFSDVDIGKAGVYRYVESDEFDILLFGYSVDHGEVKVLDLMNGDVIPEEILMALVDPDVTKWAFNAAFERICLSAWLRKNRPDLFEGYGDAEDCTGNYLDPKGWKEHGSY